MSFIIDPKMGRRPPYGKWTVDEDSSEIKKHAGFGLFKRILILKGFFNPKKHAYKSSDSAGYKPSIYYLYEGDASAMNWREFMSKLTEELRGDPYIEIEERRPFTSHRYGFRITIKDLDTLEMNVGDWEIIEVEKPEWGETISGYLEEAVLLPEDELWLINEYRFNIELHLRRMRLRPPAYYPPCLKVSFRRYTPKERLVKFYRRLEDFLEKSSKN